jgi:uncharacterized protein
LQRLMEREPPLARVLARQPGTKESRYMHLFSGDAGVPEESDPVILQRAVRRVEEGSRLSMLEGQVESLKQEVTELKRQLAEFRDQFR